jgi:hypothetical protein
MNGSNTNAPRKAVMVVVLGVAACGRVSAPTAPFQQQSLDPAAQHAAAEKIARGFAGVCLTARDALAATRALESQGWPRFGVVWDQLDSVFYAAKPSPASPAGLFVISDQRWQGTATFQMTCVGHYPADGALPMIEAIERRWGASQPGPSTLPNSRAWAFRMVNGTLTPTPASLGFGGPATAAALGGLRAGEAFIFVQVYYNPALHDVASLVSIRRSKQ